MRRDFFPILCSFWFIVFNHTQVEWKIQDSHYRIWTELFKKPKQLFLFYFYKNAFDVLLLTDAWIGVMDLISETTRCIPRLVLFFFGCTVTFVRCPWTRNGHTTKFSPMECKVDDTWPMETFALWPCMPPLHDTSWKHRKPHPYKFSA